MNENEKAKEVLALLDKHVKKAMLYAVGCFPHADTMESSLKAIFMSFKRECDLLSTSGGEGGETVQEGQKNGNERTLLSIGKNEIELASQHVKAMTIRFAFEEGAIWANQRIIDKNL